MNELGTEEKSSAATLKSGAGASALKAALKLTASISCVALALSMVDRTELRALLLRSDISWLAAGLAVSLVIYAAQALRWSFIARRLRLELRFKDAWLEGYLAALLNQTLPTGYAGESMRILRLARHNRHVSHAAVRALLTVVLDRLSGQWILWLCIGLSVPAWVSDSQVAGLSILIAFICAAGSIAVLRRPTLVLPRRLAQDAPAYLADITQAVVSRGAWALQLGTSLTSVFGCWAMYFCALRALAVELAFLDFWRVAPLMLAATSLPISFAGWGPREIASAALFAQIGLDAESGTAASIVYGLMSLTSSLPGVLAWWRR